MRINLIGTANLGDFLNGLPVLSGISKTYGKIDLIIKSDMKKFNGLKEFLMFQDIFSSVEFEDDVFVAGEIYMMSSWPAREDRNDPNRPIETCRYENFMKDGYKWEFEVDDEFVVLTPEYDIEIKDKFYVGDRWAVGNIDTRRETHVLANMENCEYIDFNRPMLENAYIIKNLKKPFITNFTGVGMLADLCNVPLYCVWKAEDWDPAYRVGNDISWDNGKNINQVFEKHFYLDRKAKLVHANDLKDYLE